MKIEAAASCDWSAGERIAVAAGTGTGTGTGSACGSSWYAVVEAFAGSWCSAAGSLVPSHPCFDGGVEPAKSC